MLSRAFRLEGTSMSPLFKAGEIVLIQPLNLKLSLSPGDCVVYEFERRTLLHRVIAVEETGLLISDDAGLLSPHKVPWEDIAGRVTTSNPLKKGFGGRLYSRLRRFLTRSRRHPGGL